MNKQFEDHQIWGECYDNTDEVLLQTTCLPIAMYFNVSKQLYTDDSQIALYDSLSLLWPESKCHPILILYLAHQCDILHLLYCPVLSKCTA